MAQTVDMAGSAHLTDQPAIARAAAVDTTAGSLLHQIFIGRNGLGPPPARSTLYLVAIALTFIPLLLAVPIGATSLATPSPELRLPFLRDWNVGFMFLVTLPCILVFAVTDQQILGRALITVQAEGTIILPKPQLDRLFDLWQRRFR